MGSDSVVWPHPRLYQVWAAEGLPRGCTEPWTLQLICADIRERGYKSVLECGTSIGFGTCFLADTGADVTSVEIEKENSKLARKLLEECGFSATLVVDQVMNYLKAQPSDSFDAIYLDDNHELRHVANELVEAKRIAREGGTIYMHDVIGDCALDVLVKMLDGEIAETERVHPSGGGLGIIRL